MLYLIIDLVTGNFSQLQYFCFSDVSNKFGILPVIQDDLGNSLYVKPDHFINCTV